MSIVERNLLYDSAPNTCYLMMLGMNSCLSSSLIIRLCRDIRGSGLFLNALRNYVSGTLYQPPGFIRICISVHIFTGIEHAHIRTYMHARCCQADYLNLNSAQALQSCCYVLDPDTHSDSMTDPASTWPCFWITLVCFVYCLYPLPTSTWITDYAPAQWICTLLPTRCLSLILILPTAQWLPAQLFYRPGMGPDSIFN